MDIEEFETKIDPSQGISALPLSGNIYEWHANVKGFEETPYENGIFHFKIIIPKDYPNSAPEVTSLTPIHNGFFMGQKFHIDMLNPNEWCSGYSIASVLTQL